MKQRRTSNKPEYRGVSGSGSVDLTARHEAPWESRSWQWYPPGSARRACTERRDGNGEDELDSRRTLLPPRSHSPPQLPGFRPGLSGDELDTVLHGRSRRKQATSGGAGGVLSGLTLGGRAFPNTKPFFAFCIRGGDKANAGRACATTTLNA